MAATMREGGSVIEIRVRTEAERETALVLHQDGRIGEVFPEYAIRFEHAGHVSTIAGRSHATASTVTVGSPLPAGGGGGGSGGNATIVRHVHGLDQICTM